MSIQVKDGWWYKTRGGDVVHITGNDGSPPWIFRSDIGTTYRPDGTFEYETGVESALDLVVEIGPDRDRNTFVHRETVAVEPEPVSITIPEHPPYNHGQDTHSLSEALTCFVSFRDSPDVEVLPDNTYAHILPNGALLVRTLGDDRQVALFAPNSWVNYVNKGAK